jgi:hypothetical protein
LALFLCLSRRLDTLRAALEPLESEMRPGFVDFVLTVDYFYFIPAVASGVREQGSSNRVSISRGGVLPNAFQRKRFSSSPHFFNNKRKSAYLRRG